MFYYVTNRVEEIPTLKKETLKIRPTLEKFSGPSAAYKRKGIPPLVNSSGMCVLSLLNSTLGNQQFAVFVMIPELLLSGSDSTMTTWHRTVSAGDMAPVAGCHFLPVLVIQELNTLV